MIDIHCHLEYMKDIAEVLETAREKKMTGIITSTPNPEDVGKMLELVRMNRDFVYHTIGFHPCHIPDYSDEQIEAHMALIADNHYDIVGIGEVGLDYKDVADGVVVDKQKQQEVFARFIDLALELELPLVVHCRDAFADALKILTEKKAPHVIFHCFSGSESELKYILAQPHWFISYATNVCFTQKHPRLAALTPLNRMLLETDAPWLDPDIKEGERGLTNRPWKIAHSASVIGKLKGFTAEEVLAATTANAKKAFRFV